MCKLLVCKLFALKRANQSGDLPFLATEFGTWWGTNPTRREQTDIDVVAADKTERRILLGECKWREHVNASQTLQALEERADLIKGYEHPWFYLFTKHQVSKKEKTRKESATVRFVDASEMYDL